MPAASVPPPSRGPADAGAAAAALRALGAEPLGALAVSDDATSTLDAVPPGAHIAVVALLEVRTGTVRLHLGDGADSLTCTARDTPYDLALFAAAAPLHLAVTPTSDPAEARLLAASAFALPPAMRDPARLIPRPPLTPSPDWNLVYGGPAIEDVAARLRARVFADLAAPVLVPWGDAQRLWLEPGDELSRLALITGLYEPETMLFIGSRLAPGGVFVDIGAHCGTYSLHAAAIVGRHGQVLAFEPSPREFARLTANIAANDLPQIRPHCLAIADAPGPIALHIAEPGHAGHNTIGHRFAYAGVREDTTRTVPAGTLDQVLAGLDRCDVIKMDIEGAELRALRGGVAALARLRPVLVLEMYDAALAANDATVADLLAWLDAHGYDVHEIDPATAGVGERATTVPRDSRNIIALPRVLPAAPP